MLRDTPYLLDILQAARLACSYVANKTIDDFIQDIQCQDAVIRRLEIIGEAARRLSDETRLSLPDIPFSTMADMRNLLIHEYDGVDLSIVWDTVESDLPALIATLEKIVPPEEPT